jgi:hypothetical protein
MLLGLIMLVAAWGVNQNGWVICYAWSLFIYGIGVGKSSVLLIFPSSGCMSSDLQPQVENTQ